MIGFLQISPIHIHFPRCWSLITSDLTTNTLDKTLHSRFVLLRKMCLECKRGNVINEACRILLPSDRCSHDRYADCVQNQCFSYRQPEDLLHKRWHAGHPVAACRRLNCFPEDHSEDSAKESLLIPAGEGCAHREMAECWDNGCFHWTEHRGVCHHGNVFEPSSHWSEACANPQLTEHRHIDTMEDLRRRLSAREG